MPYTGNLVRLAQQPDARRLPPPSPRHGTSEDDPSVSRGEHQVASGTGAEFAGTTYAPVIMSGFGMPLDSPASWAGPPPGGAQETPYTIGWTGSNPHDSPAVLSLAGSNAQYAGDAIRLNAHDGHLDHGYNRTVFDPEPLYDNQQDRAELDTDGLASPYDPGAPASHTKFVRGINSLPENNPGRLGYDGPGFRRGRERVRVWDPTNTRAHVSRLQGVQILQPRDAYTPNFVRPIVTDMLIGPALPRDSSPPDEALLAATSYASSPTSVIGGF